MASPGPALSQDEDIKLVDYVNARATEMESMASTVSRVKGNNKAAQKVPIHMRRRAASYNIKRLPRTLREKAVREMQKAPPKPSKVPSRKHRRRAKNLLSEYNRRKRRIVWLETHIWHAKRFHMLDRWRHKLAVHANDKGARASYRAGDQYCQLWDMSYLGCIEIVGSQDELLDKLSRVSSSKTGQAFASLVTLSGSVAGMTMLYEANQYPEGAIGPVQFIWKPATTTGNSRGKHRTLWIWYHPAIFEQIQAEIISLFDLKCKDEVSPDAMVECDGVSKSEDTVVESGGVSNSEDVNPGNSKKSDIYKKYPKVQSLKYGSGKVNMTVLLESLCRFKLRGPMSRTILTDALKIADINATTTAETTDSQTRWWQCLDNESRDTHAQQEQLWAELSRTPSWEHMPPGVVFGLTVRDPRLFLPKKKCMILSEEETTDVSMEEVQEEMCSAGEESAGFQWPDVSKSPLWSHDVRDKVKDTMLTDQQLNQRRSENTIPGLSPELGNEESRVPVLLIHDQAHLTQMTQRQKTCCYGDAWDVVVPAGWAMPFLIAMVYRGARVGGLFELQKSNFEMGRYYFPLHYPDTKAGLAEQEEIRTEQETVHLKKPPAKRVNYTKHGVMEPFHCPWKKLISEWCPTTISGSSNILVLRDISKLKYLEAYLRQSHGNMTWSGPINFLVPVKLEMTLKGCCKSLSSICTPSAADMDTLAQDAAYGGPVEPVHSDDYIAKLKLTQDKDTVKGQDSIIEHCSPQTAGFVCEGGFSFRYGHGTGVGFVALPWLLSENVKTLLRLGKDRLIVLVRDPATFQYRFAILSIHL